MNELLLDTNINDESDSNDLLYNILYTIIPENKDDLEDRLTNEFDINESVDNNDLCLVKCFDSFNNEDQGCADTDVSANNGNVCCLGQKACYYSDITVTSGDSGNDNGIIYCDSWYSCEYSDINNVNGNVIVGGHYGARLSTIAFGNILACRATFSCSTSNIYNGENLFCEGTESCKFTTIENVNNIYGLGFQALEDATININSDISDDSVNIYLLSPRSGHGLTINCDESIECLVYCGNTGCDDVISELYYLSNIEISNDIVYELYTVHKPPTASPTSRPTNEPTRAWTEGKCCHGRDDTDEYELYCNQFNQISKCTSSSNFLKCVYDIKDVSCL